MFTALSSHWTPEFKAKCGSVLIKRWLKSSGQEMRRTCRQGGKETGWRNIWDFDSVSPNPQ